LPIYAYKCHNCKSVFEVRHGMFFEQNRCIKCHRTECLEKLVSPIISNENSPKIKEKVGDKVKEHIEQAKSEVKKEKEQLREKKL
jgi:putative FmdB family regulatory protein